MLGLTGSAGPGRTPPGVRAFPGAGSKTSITNGRSGKAKKVLPGLSALVTMSAPLVAFVAVAPDRFPAASVGGVRVLVRVGRDRQVQRLGRTDVDARGQVTDVDAAVRGAGELVRDAVLRTRPVDDVPDLARQHGELGRGRRHRHVLHHLGVRRGHAADDDPGDEADDERDRHARADPRVPTSSVASTCRRLGGGRRRRLGRGPAGGVSRAVLRVRGGSHARERIRGARAAEGRRGHPGRSATTVSGPAAGGSPRYPDGARPGRRRPGTRRTGPGRPM